MRSQASISLVGGGPAVPESRCRSSPGSKGAPVGRVLPPQVADVANDSELAQSEHFSPIAPLIRAAGEDDALRMANGTEFGLSSAVFTENEKRGLSFAQRLEAGMTRINDISPMTIPMRCSGERRTAISAVSTATGSFRS
jgi:aldehyde dehydrogenase (NAD+)